MPEVVINYNPVVQVLLKSGATVEMLDSEVDTFVKNSKDAVEIIRKVSYTPNIPEGTLHIPNEDMLSFLEENRELIQVQHSERARKPFSEQLEPYTEEMSDEDDVLLEGVNVA